MSGVPGRSRRCRRKRYPRPKIILRTATSGEVFRPRMRDMSALRFSGDMMSANSAPPYGFGPRGYDGTVHTRNTFITSSPRWLMTFTAIRPDFGFSNARDVSLLSVAQASASISALRVFLSAP